MQVFRAVVRGLAVADLSGRIILAEQPAQNVDLMNHRVLNRHGVVPVVRNGRVTVCTVQQQRFAVLSAVDSSLQLLVALVIAAHEADLNQLFAGLHLGLDDALAGVRLGRERLLAEYVLAGRDGRQNVFLVIRVSRGAHNRVNLGVIDHINRVFKALDAVLLGNRKAESARRVGAGDDLAALQGVVDALDMAAADAAGAYKTNSQSFHSIFLLLLRFVDGVSPCGTSRREKW